ncbi:MAG: hypothetical protein EOM40_13095 [Clostridia bacterium]|nr:hypothetical protein [Clostridia bacterium]NCC42403.1 hypothetical protein [Clostridia bacterium]
MDFKQKIKDIWAKRPQFKLPFGKKEEIQEAPVGSVMEYKERVSRHKRKLLIRTGIAAAVVVLAAVGGKLLIDKWSYNGYKIVIESSQEDTVSAKYAQFNDNILKYGGDDVTLMSRQGENLWSEAHTMENPEVEICQEMCVVYDKKGTTMSVFDISGKVGQIQTSLPILKATVAKQGVVAAILEDGETTWVNVYDVDGDEIVTGKTRIDSPGYPVDLSLSDDGLLMAVSYLSVRDNKPAGYVAFYNFGNTGQNQMDNMVSAYTYTDTLVPETEYLGNSTAVAFRDDGFVIYKGRQIPEEQTTVEVKDDILSTFYDEDNIGLVFRNEEGEHPYRMEIYNTSGTLKYTAGLDISFDHISVSKDQIILFNSNEFAIYTLKGVCRYQGTLKEGIIQNVFKMARNRYIVVMEGGIETIKLN